MLTILLNILNLSRYIMKETHQKVEIWTSQKLKKEIRLKTRVLPPQSPRKKKEEEEDGRSAS